MKKFIFTLYYSTSQSETMGGSRKFRQGGGGGGGVLTTFFSHQCILQVAVQTSLGKQLDPRGPIASRGGSVPVFLRKPIATCDFF